MTGHAQTGQRQRWGHSVFLECKSAWGKVLQQMRCCSEQHTLSASMVNSGVQTLALRDGWHSSKHMAGSPGRWQGPGPQLAARWITGRDPEEQESQQHALCTASRLRSDPPAHPQADRDPHTPPQASPAAEAVVRSRAAAPTQQQAAEQPRLSVVLSTRGSSKAPPCLAAVTTTAAAAGVCSHTGTAIFQLPRGAQPMHQVHNLQPTFGQGAGCSATDSEAASILFCAAAAISSACRSLQGGVDGVWQVAWFKCAL